MTKAYWMPQAALTAMEKRSKNALARTERMCEATMDSVRTGAAASLATEVRRLEGMLTGHAVQFADMNRAGPSTQMHHVPILHDEVGFAYVTSTLRYHSSNAQAVHGVDDVSITCVAYDVLAASIDRPHVSHE